MSEAMLPAQEIVARLFADLAADGLVDVEDTPAGAAAAGRVLGDYRLLHRLGRGGMGEVWEAEQPALGRRVALKLLEERMLDSPSRRARFLREAEAGARLRHPGIVSVIAIGEYEGTLFIAQELVPGGRSFADELAEQRRGGPPPADHYRRLARRFAALADALAYAHAQGILHRDIKPSNILVEEDGRLRLGDFGLARMLDEPLLSRTGDVMGTPCYMSPEHLAGRPEEMGPQSDVFSLGVTLFEAFTLALPFDGDSSAEIFDKIRRADPPEPRRLRARMPRELSLITLKALEKDRARRYAGVQELAADLHAFLEHRPVSARPPGAGLRAAKWARRHPVVAASATVAAAAFMAITLLLLDARRARDRAEIEARTAFRTSGVLENLFLNAAPGELQAGFSAADLLRRSVAEADALEDEPAVQLRLLSTLSHVYWSMGELDEAEELARRELAVAAREFGEESTEHAVAVLDLSQVEVERGALERALELSRRAHKTLLHTAGPQDRRTLRAGMLHGQYLSAVDEFDAAREVLEQVVAAPEAVLPRGSAEWLGARAGLARLLQRRGDFAAAEHWSRELIAAATAQRGAEDPFTMGERRFLGQVLLGLQRLNEAEHELTDCLRWYEQVHGADNPAALEVLSPIGLCYAMQGRDAEAEAAYQRALAGLSALYPRNYAAIFDLRVHLGALYLRRGDWDRAAEFVTTLPGAAAASFGAETMAAAYARVLNGWLHVGRSEFESAAAELEAALAFLHERYGLAHPYSQTAVSLLAEACTGLGTPQRALPLLEQALAALQERGLDSAAIEEALAALRASEPAADSEP